MDPVRAFDLLSLKEGNAMQTNQESALGEEVGFKLKPLVAKLAGLSNGVDIGSLVNEFVACFDLLPRYAGYKHMPIAATKVHALAVAQFGAQAAREFLYVCILGAVLKSLGSATFQRLPARVKGHQLKQYRRIVNSPSAVIDGCELDKDLFHKELGLALLRLYGAAAQLIDFRAGVGRAILVKNGLHDVPRRLAIFAKIGGFKPFFEIHTHLSYLDEFNEEGWNECYRCCADLYELHPAVLGMHGGSWFYDPSLDAISPRLGYLREVPQKGGAYLLFDSVSDQSTQDAISTSPTRKKLYQERKYQPKSYALIWPRRQQIAWAADHALRDGKS